MMASMLSRSVSGGQAHVPLRRLEVPEQRCLAIEFEGFGPQGRDTRRLRHLGQHDEVFGYQIASRSHVLHIALDAGLHAQVEILLPDRAVDLIRQP
jgi:hypothetical protein